MDLQKLRVVEVRRESPRAVHLRLEDGPGGLHDAFTRPAMTIAVRPEGGTETVRLPLAGQPGRRHFEVLVDTETSAGARLAALRPGDDLRAGKPDGPGFDLFSYRRCDVYLVAYGTGIAPIRSAILHLLTERGAFDAVRLLYEARFLRLFCYRDEFPSWQRGGVKVYQVIARPDVAKWRRGEQAYVTDLLDDLRPDPARSVVFAAGPTDLLMGVQHALRARDYPPERLFIHEIEPTAEVEREETHAPRDPAALERVSVEGKEGSGHWNDPPDHPPMVSPRTAAPPSAASKH
jgi:ferredoxin-NADP reductase